MCLFAINSITLSGRYEYRLTTIKLYFAAIANDQRKRHRDKTNRKAQRPEIYLPSGYPRQK